MCAKRCCVTHVLKIHVSGQDVPVEVQANPRARRLQFRLDPRTGNVRLTLPPGTSPARGLAFVRSKADWIRARRAKILESQISLEEGSEVPIDGVLHTLKFAPRPALHPGSSVEVRADQPAQDLTKLVKTHARTRLTPLAHQKAAHLGLPISRLSFRDTKSRWGSCSTDGAISLNWRLACADPLIQDYLVAHEVAHLKEPHHQPAFWDQCARLMAQPQALDTARNRLRVVGPRLMALPFG